MEAFFAVDADRVTTVVELPRAFDITLLRFEPPQCGVGGDDVDLTGEKVSEGDAEAFLCYRRIWRACSSG